MSVCLAVESTFSFKAYTANSSIIDAFSSPTLPHSPLAFLPLQGTHMPLLQKKQVRSYKPAKAS